MKRREFIALPCSASASLAGIGAPRPHRQVIE